MTSFGDIRRYLATTASKPCFTLYVIHLVVRCVFSMFSSFIWLFGAYFLCFWYWCTLQN